MGNWCIHHLLPNSFTHRILNPIGFSRSSVSIGMVHLQKSPVVSHRTVAAQAHTNSTWRSVITAVVTVVVVVVALSCAGEEGSKGAHTHTHTAAQQTHTHKGAITHTQITLFAPLPEKEQNKRHHDRPTHGCAGTGSPGLQQEGPRSTSLHKHTREVSESNEQLKRYTPTARNAAAHPNKRKKKRTVTG
ncbi:hypothetical protein DQ04_03421010 [Trypanosoma grayi]|uniref:hypothetical protein n=1 Tax=Trypanosoma grayi TaxID=71804 RepID=UPI0004F43CAF|nr:hypothetical protein DQ04_03421010 [Trypanosoma grayi]KEG10675.1 hypothetical protein DQ04_03421010 [Trypanosoma grayi]